MKRLAIPLMMGLLLTACKKFESEQPSGKQVPQPSAMADDAFSPPINVSVENEMLSFETYDDFQEFSTAVQEATPAAVKAWEESIGFRSQRTRFFTIVENESNLDAYFESLPADEQQQVLNGPEQHSDAYTAGIDEGFIVASDDPEAAAYDYAICLPAYAGVVNDQGFVRIENKIYQVTSSAIKIILDGDYGKMSLLNDLNSDLAEENGAIIVNIHTAAKATGSGPLHTNFSSWIPDWHYTGNKTRLKAWVEGYSYPYGKPYYSDCAQFLQCTFQLRTEAQKKNFWGKWVFNNYYPTFIVQNGNWSYSYKRFNDKKGCGLYSISQSNNLSYGSWPHPAYPVLVNHNYGGTNKGYFSLVPHGVWASSYNPGYFSAGFTLSYNFTLNYGGKIYNFVK